MQIRSLEPVFFSVFPRAYLKYASSKQAAGQEDQSTKSPDPGNSIPAEGETFRDALWFSETNAPQGLEFSPQNFLLEEEKA